MNYQYDGFNLEAESRQASGTKKADEHWLKKQPPQTGDDMYQAVAEYLAVHGPHNWSFQGEEA